MIIRIFILILWAEVLMAQNTVSDLFVPIKTNNQWGFIDKNGNLKIEAKYDYVDTFDTFGYAVVALDNKVGIINKKGNTVIPIENALVKVLAKEIFLVKNDGKWGIRNFNNEVLINDVGGNVKMLDDKYFVYEKIDGFGYGHLHRGIISEAAYTDIEIFNDTNFIKVSFFNKCGLRDAQGKWILPIDYNDIKYHSGFILAKKNNLFAVFDSTGKCLQNNIYNSFSPLGKDFIVLNKLEKSYLFSLRKKEIIQINFEQASLNADYIEITISNYKKGLLNIDGELVIDTIYQDIEYFNSDIFKVSNRSKWGLVKLGKKQPLLNLIYDEIEDLNGPIAKITLDDFSGIVNKDGEITFKPTLKSFEYGNNCIKINENNKLRIYYFDENGNFKEESEYDNYRKIKIDRNNSSVLSSAQQNFRLRVEINDSLIWTKGPNNKWGIYNINIRKFILPPTYERFEHYPEFDMYLVEVMKPEIAKISIYGASSVANSAWLFISNKVYLPLTKPEFIHIEMDDFITDSLPVARCILANGDYGLVNTKGKIIASGMVYIGKFIDGKALCTKSGSLMLDPKKKNESIFTASEFYAKLKCKNRQLNNFNYENSYVVSKSCEWGYINTSGKWVIDGTKMKFEYASDFVNKRALVIKNKKWGMIDELGSLVLPLVYEEISFIPNSDKKLYYVYLKNEKFGFIDNNAKLVLPLKYDKIGEYKENMIAICIANKWGFANEYGTETIKFNYRMVSDFSEGLAAVTENGVWGYINKSGSYIIKPQFVKTNNFSEGLALVRTLKNKLVYIDPSGNTIIDIDLADGGNFKNGIAKVLIKNKGWCLIDKEGNLISKPQKNWLNISEFDSNGIAKIIVKNKGYALINQSGKVITKKHYHEIFNFSEGFAVVRTKRGRLSYSGIIDTSGSETIRTNKLQIGPVCNGRAVYKEGTNYGYIDPYGKVIVDAQYIKADNFFESKAVVYKSANQTGVIDSMGNYIISPTISKIMEFSDGYALIMSPKFDYYFLGTDLKRHTIKNYTSAKNFCDGVAPVNNAGLWSIINNKGFELTSSKFQNIDKFKNGFAKVKISRKVGVVNEKGQIIAEPDFDYINYYGEDVFRVEKENSIGYLNGKGQWVWKNEY